MKDRKSQPEVVALNAGGYGCWIGPKTSQQVLLYFHGLQITHLEICQILTRSSGGGYVTSAVTAHMEMLGDLVALAHDQKKDFSVLAVEYSRFCLVRTTFTLLITHRSCARELVPSTVSASCARTGLPDRNSRMCSPERELPQRSGYTPLIKCIRYFWLVTLPAGILPSHYFPHCLIRTQRCR